MPKFIGNRIPGCSYTENNVTKLPGHVRLTYAQSAKLAPCDVVASLDTTDRGGPRRFAKRWFRWFARPEAILRSADSTQLMIARASAALGTR